MHRGGGVVVSAHMHRILDRGRPEGLAVHGEERQVETDACGEGAQPQLTPAHRTRARLRFEVRVVVQGAVPGAVPDEATAVQLAGDVTAREVVRVVLGCRARAQDGAARLQQGEWLQIEICEPLEHRGRAAQRADRITPRIRRTQQQLDRLACLHRRRRARPHDRACSCERLGRRQQAQRCVR